MSTQSWKGLVALGAIGGCTELLGLNDFQSLSAGARCGTDVPGWACAEGLRCDDEGTKTCVPIGGAGGTGGGGAGGTGGGCTDGETQACAYTGPVGTDGVGPCKAGTRSCVGGVFGPCAGEVVPTSEIIGSGGDEDCDGLASGELRWWHVVPSNASGRIAASPDGGFVVAGGFSQTLDFGGGVVLSTSGGLGDAFVAKFASDGTLAWAKRFGAGGDEGAVAAVAPNGDVVLGVNFAGTLDLGGGALQSAGGADFALARLGPDGSHLWSKRFGTAGGEGVSSVSVSSDGDIAITGSFDTALALDGAPALQPVGGGDMFVARLDPSGTAVWSASMGAAGAQYGDKVLFDGNGNVHVQIYTGDDIPGVAALDTFFYRRYDPFGVMSCETAFGVQTDFVPTDFSVDTLGRIVVVGTLDGAYWTATSTGVRDLLRVRRGANCLGYGELTVFHAPTGAVGRVAVVADDETHLLVELSGSLAFPGGTVAADPNQPYPSVHAIELDAADALRFSVFVGAVDNARCSAARAEGLGLGLLLRPESGVDPSGQPIPGISSLVIQRVDP